MYLIIYQYCFYSPAIEYFWFSPVLKPLWTDQIPALILHTYYKEMENYVPWRIGDPIGASILIAIIVPPNDIMQNNCNIYIFITGKVNMKKEYLRLKWGKHHGYVYCSGTCDSILQLISHTTPDH